MITDYKERLIIEYNDVLVRYLKLSNLKLSNFLKSDKTICSKYIIEQYKIMRCYVKCLRKRINEEEIEVKVLKKLKHTKFSYMLDNCRYSF